ncbi:disulfide bond formation protein DsbA [Candidatus Saccharibacteria bacterium]|nr:MAG: disulfide bond formation protein DsbA [Candidatus Saccharibacteria bacterium]
MNRTRWIIFSVFILALIGTLVYTSNKDSNSANKIDPQTIQKTGPNADRVYGNKDAKVVLFEYGDFQCPSCGNAYPIVKQVKEKYKDQIAFVYRNYPLTSIHPHALAASTAAEAAGKQGKFWEMHDKLFENQQAWSSVNPEVRTQVFEGYARELGLNIDQFNKDLRSEDVKNKVARDRQIGRDIGVSGTPTFFLQGRQLENNQWNSVEALDKTIADALKQAGVSAPQAPESTEQPAQ